MHCTFLLRTIFASLAHANKHAHVQNLSDFPQTKLDSEVNAHILLNKHGDPHFLFYKFSENNILNNRKNRQKSMATFLENEINAIDRDVTGPQSKSKPPVAITFPQQPVFQNTKLSFQVKSFGTSCKRPLLVSDRDPLLKLTV